MPPKNRIVLLILCTAGLLYFLMASIPLVEGQQAPTTTAPVIDLGWPQQLERLGLVGSLLVAVWLLWITYQKLLDKKDAELAKKDEVMMALIAKVTESMGSFQEFRRALDANVHANEEMAEALRLLQSQIIKLPCTIK